MSRTVDISAAALERHFGAGVLCAVVPVDGDPAALLPVERSVVAAAVPARQREFAAGRTSARALLGCLGFAPAALLPGPERDPQWPPGALGSIAHDDTLCAVAVARTQRFASLGLDLEPAEPLEEELWSTLFLPRELALLRASPRAARGRTARLLFSAKECVYKCLHPLYRTPLGFHDVEVLPVAESERFRARLRPELRGPLRDQPLHGFHLQSADSILTGMALARLPALTATTRDGTGARA